MNIIKSQAEDRKVRVETIVATIQKVFSAGMAVNKEKIIAEICLRFSCSRRTTLEYLNIALVAFNTEEEKVDCKVMIKEIK